MRFQVPINVPAWWLIMMPVLMILLIGIIVLIAINIANTKQKYTEDKGEEAENKKSKDKTLTSWIKKKDLLYWLLIVCLGTISLFTFRYKDATEVISHWGFAGTIVSIILAVIAIGFTLFQTLSSDLSSVKIAEAANIIEKASEGIDTSELINSSKIMKDASNILKEEMDFIKHELEIIKQGQESSNYIIKDIFKVNQNENNESTSIETKIPLSGFLNNIFPNLPFNSQLYTYVHFKFLSSKNIHFTKKSRDAILNELTQIKLDELGEQVKNKREFYRGTHSSSFGSIYSILNITGISKEFKESNGTEQNKIMKEMEGVFEQRENFLYAIKNFFNTNPEV